MSFWAPKYFLILCFFIIFTFLLTVYYNKILSKEAYEPKRNLISMPFCKIADLHAFSSQAMAFIDTVPEIKCSEHPPLIQSNQTTVWIDENAMKTRGLSANLSCCFRGFTRAIPDDKKQGEKVDKLVVFSETCEPFSGSASVYEEFVEVTCKDSGKTVYKDYHAFIVPKRRQTSNPVTPRKSITEKPSVIIIGADAISRLNFYRQMPKTLKMMRELDAVELLGHNKVADNTFPNIMPLLTGFSEQELVNNCWPQHEAYFDKCHFLWNDFSNKGYLTAFAEDTCWMGLFLYLKAGFKMQPTDYYSQPYMLQNEAGFSIGHTSYGNAYACSGSRLALDVLLDYAKKTTVNLTTQNLPFFGYFWGTSLSHDFLNIPVNGDNLYESVFKQFRESGVFEKSVVIFMSDHGLRWGSFRYTHQGYMEDRLPFVYIMIPKWMRKQFPKAYENLISNTKKLTTNYDIRETILDLLRLKYLQYYDNRSLISGERGISLFTPVPNSRSCDSAGIPEHYCACHRHSEISLNDIKVVAGARSIVNDINKKLKEHINEKRCQRLELKVVISAFKLESDVDEVREFLLNIMTKPGDGMFEATVQHDIKSSKVTILGDISRINSYGDSSKCMDDYKLKLYCLCM